MNGTIDERPLCRVGHCVMLCEREDGEWVCPNHGPQSYPEYEVTNTPDMTEATELGRFG